MNTVILLLLVIDFYRLFQIVSRCWLYNGCVLVGQHWDKCRLLKEWSHGWAYSGYFDYTVGWLGGCINGRIDDRG